MISSKPSTDLQLARPVATGSVQEDVRFCSQELILKNIEITFKQRMLVCQAAQLWKLTAVSWSALLTFSSTPTWSHDVLLFPLSLTVHLFPYCQSLQCCLSFCTLWDGSVDRDQFAIAMSQKPKCQLSLSYHDPSRLLWQGKGDWIYKNYKYIFNWQRFQMRPLKEIWF